MSLIGPNREAGIAIYTGLPGGGKSYCAAQLQVEWLESGNPVLSNLKVTALPFRWIKPKYGKFVLLEDADFMEFDRILDEHGNPLFDQYLDEKGKEVCEPLLELRLMKKLRTVLQEYPGKHPLVLIDEAPNYYASQDFKSNPRAMKAFLRQHRHLGVSVVAVAQNHAMLDNNFNRLCQEYRHHENLVKDSSLEYVLWWFGDNFHIAYSMANKGGKPFTKERYGRSWFRIRKQRAAVYSTIQMHASDLPGQLRKVRGRSLRLVALFLILCTFYGLYRWTNFVLFGPTRTRVVQPTEVVKVVPVESSDTVVLDSLELLGSGKIRVHVVDAQGVSRSHVLPGGLDQFYELTEKIGTQITVPKLPTRPFSTAVVEAVRK